tara:strand:+ start:240 stop:644 length:405 start_codon:yes stop_codon:yes gene_type:complete
VAAILAIAFFGLQYTAVGKGCQDILFFLIEGYEVEECRRLEPIVMAHYHSSLVQRGVTNYTFSDLRRDWKLACMHFPLYVALWRGPLAEKRRPGKRHSLAPGLLGRALATPGCAAHPGQAAAPLTAQRQAAVRP